MSGSAYVECPYMMMVDERGREGEGPQWGVDVSDIDYLSVVDDEWFVCGSDGLSLYN